VKNLPTVQPEIQNFIKSLVEGGREMWTFRDFDLDGAMEENFKKLHKAGILNVFRSPCPGPPKAHLIIEPVSFVSSPGALPEFQAWIDTLFEKHKHKSSLQSMERISDLSHREIFVWRGSATPAEISFHIMHHPDVVPNVEINVPEWVTKLWIEGPTRGTEQTFWIFEPQIGWKTFDVPSAQLIKVLERVAPTPTPGICPGTA
jgi:hypothetical protein